VGLQRTEHPDKPTLTSHGEHVSRRFSGSIGERLAETADVEGTSDDTRYAGANPAEKTRRDMTAHSTSHRIDSLRNVGVMRLTHFLRNFCTDGVHVAECRCQPVKKVTTLRRALNSAFFIVASRGRWRPHFPHQRRSMFRVCSEGSRCQPRWCRCGAILR